MNKISSVAIVGAGIAGLSCATVCRNAGLSVTVFEKSRGVSGRMSTRRGENWEADHGAQYFTARDPIFRNEVNRWQVAGVAQPWPAEIHVIGGDRAGSNDPSPERFVGTPHMTSPANFLAQDLSVKTQMTVNQVRKADGGWQISIAEAGWQPEFYGALALAIPSPQVSALFRNSALTEFDQVHDIKMQGCWTMMLRYELPMTLSFDAAFVNEGPLSWVSRNLSKPGRTGLETWVLHASPSWSEAHLEEDAQVAGPLLIEAFREMGARAPSAWSAHRWRYASSASPAAYRFWSADLALGVCGDWANGDKVQGAWLSGRDLADQITRHRHRFF